MQQFILYFVIVNESLFFAIYFKQCCHLAFKRTNQPNLAFLKLFAGKSDWPFLNVDKIVYLSAPYNIFFEILTFNLVISTTF